MPKSLDVTFNIAGVEKISSEIKLRLRSNQFDIMSETSFSCDTVNVGREEVCG